MYQQEFINKIKEGAIKGFREYGILPSLTIAQAILETGWGKSTIGKNLFGIKADASWSGKKKLIKTHEYVNGKKIFVDAYFRDYNSIYESLEDRFKFLQKPRYKKVVGEKDYRVACKEIQKAGYATDPNYPSKLIGIIEQYKLYEYDKEALKSLDNTHSDWAKESWEWAKLKGLLDGSRPKDNLIREEFAVTIKRMVR